MSVRVNHMVPVHDERSTGSGLDERIALKMDVEVEGPTSSSRDVTVVEVGPRDGLQNETSRIPTGAKIAFVDALSRAGFPVIEVTSFVNPKSVPQLSDAAEVMMGIRRAPGSRYPVLVPNERGLHRAIDAGVDAIAMFTSATDAFAAANVGSSIDETFERFAPVVTIAKDHNIWMRGYVSVAFGCPYSGAVGARDVARVAERLFALGCDEICLADTIGTATPAVVRTTVAATLQSIPLNQLALHFHDTSGTALANVAEALNVGVRLFDAAAGGLGGCPFAPGAPGNLDTRQLVNRLEALGLHTGIDLEAVSTAVSMLRPYVPKLEHLVA